MEDTNKFSKSDIIAALAEETGFSKRLIKKIVDAMFIKIEDIVSTGGIVTIQGFARFFTKEAQERSFRKIDTGEMVSVGPRDLPKTKFSKKFVSRVKG